MGDRNFKFSVEPLEVEDKGHNHYKPRIMLVLDEGPGPLLWQSKAQWDSKAKAELVARERLVEKLKWLLN